MRNHTCEYCFIMHFTIEALGVLIICLPMKFAEFRLNAYWNRWVFNFFLQLSRLGDSLVVLGSWFHNVGAEYLKDLVAKVLYLTLGLCNVISLLFEHKLSLLFSLC